MYGGSCHNAMIRPYQPGDLCYDQRDQSVSVTILFVTTRAAVTVSSWLSRSGSSLAPTSEHYDISLHNVQPVTQNTHQLLYETCSVRGKQHIVSVFNNSIYEWNGRGIKKNRQTQSMNDVNYETSGWCRLSWQPPDQFIIEIITRHIRHDTPDHDDSTCPGWVVTTLGNVSKENMIFSHFRGSNYIEFSQRSRNKHITLAYFVVQE